MSNNSKQHNRRAAAIARAITAETISSIKAYRERFADNQKRAENLVFDSAFFSISRGTRRHITALLDAGMSPLSIGEAAAEHNATAQPYVMAAAFRIYDKRREREDAELKARFRRTVIEAGVIIERLKRAADQ